MSHKPSPEGIAAIEEFFGDLNSFKYPQPDVAKILRVPQTDLNAQRRRGHLPRGWDKDTRVTFTGAGLMYAGVFNELSWLISPERTSACIADHLYPSIEYLLREGAAGSPIWTEEYDIILTLSRVKKWHGVPQSELEYEFVPIAGPAALEEIQEANVILPLTRLMLGWAVRTKIVTS